jgi:hypothetical protein
MQKPKLLHVGFPKCMSTTLQRDFFAKHPEIAFLGWGTTNTAHGWIDDEVAALCEVGIRYERVLSYDAAAAAKIFDRHVEAFEADQEKKLICLSSESFSFTMHFDVDATIKAERLKRLMGDDTKVLIIIRNQLDLFRSYYFECVRGGYPGQFGDFISFHYHYLFHSILADLQYHQLLRLYSGLFGRENVKVVTMEALITNTEAGVRNICDHVGISHVDLSLQRHNDSNDRKFLQAIRLLNEKFPNNRGNTYFGWVDADKLKPYWTVSRNLPEPGEVAANHGQQMLVYRSARAVVSDFVTSLDGSYPPQWKQMLTELYAEGNSALADETNLDLASLGYPCSRR